MKKTIKHFKVALLLGAASFVTACGMGEDTTVSSDSTSIDNSVGTASLKIAVKFPRKNISPKYIDNDIRCIEVRYLKENMTKSITLTPNSPTASLTNLIPGKAEITVIATDKLSREDNDSESYCSGNTLDKVNILAYLKEGSNQLTATLISPASWVFVDKNDNPKPIEFNKIKTDSAESISSFSIVNELAPYIYNGLETLSLDYEKLSGLSSYKVYFSGSNLLPLVDNNENSRCIDIDSNEKAEICVAYGHYYNQLIGPNIVNNAFETNPVPLSPVSDGNNQYKRMFFILGVRPNYEGSYYGQNYYNEGYINDFNAMQADNTDVIQDIENKFTYTSIMDATHMEGTILEVLIKSTQENVVCSYDKSGANSFPCPENVNTFFGEMDYIEPTSINISKNGISTLAINDNECYMDVNIEEKKGALISKFVYCEIDNDGTNYYCDYNADGAINDNDDMNGDGVINKNDNYYIYKETITNGDICVYPFKAKAEPIPETDIQLIIQ